ncbi:MAG: hypothetical protein HKN38_03670 [Altererythrobacter sp.]|nr:hypothetical protein [Altererythrobacter sp.]
MFRTASLAAALAISAFFVTPATAQNAQSTEQSVQWAEYRVVYENNPARLASGQPGGVSVRTVNGTEVLTVTRTTAMLNGVDFSEGVIEFDLALDDKRGFGGLLWHANGIDSEYFYLRQHKSGLPDAGQYTPIRHGLTSWQIYSDRNGIAPFAFTHEGWNRFKMVVEGDRADIYLNGSQQPVLHIPDLAADQGSGAIGFRAAGPNGEIRIANLIVRPLAEGEQIVGQSAADRQAPEGTIMRWSVSERFAETDVAGQLELPDELGSLQQLGTVEAEPFGIADISRLAGPDEALDTVLVSGKITAEKAKQVRLQFGYSDRVRLFLNGELIFDGSAGFRSRDFFFLGTIGFEDAVVLNLREGENTLTAAVSETFGGWGFAGAIADRTGLKIEP